MTMRKVLQEILEKNPRFHHLTPLKTKHIAHWCRCHGYTPPDPESSRSDGDSMEDVLTQIDSEPGKPSGEQPEACSHGTRASLPTPAVSQDLSYCGEQEPLFTSEPVTPPSPNTASRELFMPKCRVPTNSVLSRVIQ